MTELESKKERKCSQLADNDNKNKKGRVIIRDNNSFCPIILQNLIKISTEVYKLEPFKKAILVKFISGGQRRYWKSRVIDQRWLLKKLIKVSDIWSMC